MANGKEIPQNLRKQLAVAVRSIHWSYAIFWSLSTTQQGVLEWREGYYNGDIKSRKTLQEMELKADQIGLHRSEQLRELYKSLLECETEQQAKKSSASLSLEDLTDAEWYYLVCMSFLFSSGQGLPGQALERGETIWLCNAQDADGKVFSRSLLAKGASIQTVVCFPHLGGIIEIGVTELVPEDSSLLQHIKVSLLDISKPVCSEKSSTVRHRMDDDREKVLQSWHFMDDGVQDSMHSSDCISQAFVNQEKGLLLVLLLVGIPSITNPAATCFSLLSLSLSSSFTSISISSSSFSSHPSSNSHKKKACLRSYTRSPRARTLCLLWPISWKAQPLR
ncbi:hypothetical protein UlMin_022447 [Ulmus minor]